MLEIGVLKITVNNDNKKKILWNQQFPDSAEYFKT